MIIERSLALGDYSLSNISYYYDYNYQSSTNKIILNKIFRRGRMRF